MPIEAAADMIQVMGVKGRPNTDYKVLLSKDYSQALIMHSSGELANYLRLRFYYKLWDGNGYVVPGIDAETGIDMGTAIADLQIN
ncbi:hypothetical protein D3C80_1867800 [compost metagenome]